MRELLPLSTRVEESAITIDRPRTLLSPIFAPSLPPHARPADGHAHATCAPRATCHAPACAPSVRRALSRIAMRADARARARGKGSAPGVQLRRALLTGLARARHDYRLARAPRRWQLSGAQRRAVPRARRDGRR